MIQTKIFTCCITKSSAGDYSFGKCFVPQITGGNTCIKYMRMMQCHTAMMKMSRSENNNRMCKMRQLETKIKLHFIFLKGSCFGGHIFLLKSEAFPLVWCKSFPDIFRNVSDFIYLLLLLILLFLTVLSLSVFGWKIKYYICNLNFKLSTILQFLVYFVFIKNLSVFQFTNCFPLMPILKNIYYLVRFKLSNYKIKLNVQWYANLLY